MSDVSGYGSSPLKRGRRTKSEIGALREVMVRVITQYQPMTVRQVFYQLVSMGAIDKTEQAYKGTVVRLLGLMRREGQLPWSWIADHTRWQRKPLTFSSPRQMLLQGARNYRRAIWDAQDVYVEVWLEKDALAGVLYGVTAEWDVPLMVTRGFASLSYLHTAAEVISEVGKPAYLYYFGDYDPSGLDIPRKVEQDLREFAPGTEIHFERVAVTTEQIRRLSLPTRPTKSTDSRSKGFVGESVEVDAIDPDTLRTIVRGCIERHVDQEADERLQADEDRERVALLDLAQDWTLPT